MFSILNEFISGIYKLEVVLIEQVSKLVPIRLLAILLAYVFDEF